ncbi:DUF6574 domain-containing protein [Lacticaseibacillus daqingensis]|uniref:DUF6574 domain-containing protein n=1 Tax=Lacticaseibacillus daqingensis TaxID=2486014 RepID=UPI000F76A46A|nr:DUF6574 domain-containing protein [Lacticaseibacillus daqingensis]
MKTCPQCGSEQALAAKFCTNCGFNFAEAAAEAKPVEAKTQPVAKPDAASTTAAAPTTPSSTTRSNESLDKVKQAGLNYWAWLLAGIKKPSRSDGTGHPYFGLASLALVTLFTTIAFLKPLVSGANMANNASSSLESLFGGSASGFSESVSQTTGSLVFGTGFRLFILLAAIQFVSFLGAYLVHRTLSKTKTPFLASLNNYEQRLSITVLISAAAALLSLIGGVSIIFLLVLMIALNLLFQSVAFYQYGLSSPAKNGLDSLYLLVLITLGMTLINLILFGIFGSSLFSMLSSTLGL